jgi:hypothetical protein
MNDSLVHRSKHSVLWYDLELLSRFCVFETYPEIYKKIKVRIEDEHDTALNDSITPPNERGHVLSVTSTRALQNRCEKVISFVDPNDVAKDWANNMPTGGNTARSKLSSMRLKAETAFEKSEIMEIIRAYKPPKKFDSSDLKNPFNY